MDVSIRKNYLEKMDIRAKTILFFCIIVLTFLFNNPLACMIMALTLLICVIPARIDLSGVYSALKSLIFLFLIIVVMTCFTTPSKSFIHDVFRTNLFQAGPLTATLGGVCMGLTFLLRIFLMVFSTAVFTVTTPIDDLLEFFSRMKAPYSFSIMITTAISFVPRMVQKKDMIFQAQKTRGAGISQKGIISSLRAFIPIMIPLITNSILMSDNLAISMSNRGYGANNTITSMKDIKMKLSDFAISVISVAILIICTYARIKYQIGRL